MNAQHKQLVDRLEASGEEFAKALLSLSEEELKRVPAPNEWALHQTAMHMRDVEVEVFLYRVKRILTENQPAVPNFDPDARMKQFYSSEIPAKKIASEFLRARRQIVKLLRATKDKDWARIALHSTYGKISLEWIVTHFYGHTLEHTGQILYARDATILKKLNAQ